MLNGGGTHRWNRSRKSLPSVVLIATSFSWVFACCGQEDSAPVNVVLISLDTLRADHVGCYGYNRPTTPVIDALAERGTIFERAVADSPWTLPSHASILTGLQPRHHGVRSHDTGLPETVPTLATELAARGYLTMAIVNSRNLLPRYGLHRGFRQFEYFPERQDGRQIRSGAAQVDLAIDWISQEREGPFFLFLHNYDVHSDYDPSPVFAEQFIHPYSGSIRGTTKELMRVRRGDVKLNSDDLQHVVDLYDAGIREIDHELGRLFEFLDDADLLSQTLLVVTSDHGEEFLEHGGVLHGRTMHRELLNVPLIFKGPAVPEGRRVQELAQMSDIFATVFEILGFELGVSTDGVSLVATWDEDRGSVSSRRVYAEADHNREIGDDTLEMVQTEAFKLVFERPTQEYWLYDLAADPAEQVDVSTQHPEIERGFLEDLRSLYEGRRSGSHIAPLSQSEQDALRSLGYLR